jgi:hypothetical protein
MTSKELETILLSMECKTRASFENKLAENADGMIVLDFFDHIVDEHQISPNGVEKVVQVINKAFVFSSPRLLSNIKRSVEGKRGNLNVMADGTFQLSNCRWVLVDFGTTSVVYSNSPKHITSCLYYYLNQPFRYHHETQEHRQRFIPWGYLMCPTETTESIQQAFEAIKHAASTFFGLHELEVFYYFQSLVIH